MKLLPHSAYLSHHSYGSFQPSHSSSLLFLPPDPTHHRCHSTVHLKWYPSLHAGIIFPSPLEKTSARISTWKEHRQEKNIKNIPLDIHNIYIARISCYPSDFTPSFHLHLNFCDNNIIIGVFNAQSPVWYFQTKCTLAQTRESLITESLTNSKLLLHNFDSPTRVPCRRDPTYPDFMIASFHLALDSDWHTLTTLNSDHLQIIVQLGSSFKMNFEEPTHRTFMHYPKRSRLGLVHSWSGGIVRSTGVTFLLQHGWAREPQDPKLLRQTPHPPRSHH